jgi:predicted ATPase
MTANVVELMTTKLQRLPEVTQQVVKLAACIGNPFDLQTLALVHEQSPAKTLHDVWEALQEGLIVPLDDSYKYVAMIDIGNTALRGGEFPSLRQAQDIAWEGTGVGFPSWEGQGWVSTSFKFLHDLVQQAAYTLIAEDQKHAIHLQIGRLLLAKIPEAERDDKIFEIVNHLNMGKELITVQTEKNELAELNLQAGRKARASAAYPQAFTYL